MKLVHYNITPSRNGVVEREFWTTGNSETIKKITNVFCQEDGGYIIREELRQSASSECLLRSDQESHDYCICNSRNAFATSEDGDISQWKILPPKLMLRVQKMIPVTIGLDESSELYG